jgi:tripartite-type tricarboxylate transporter receptor subunit TctC
MMRTSLLVFSVAATLFPLTSIAQSAGNYPAKPVKVVVAQAAGGATDLQARLYSTKLSETIGQQFFVENREGAGNTIGFTYAAKQAPDGYTLLAVTPSFTVSPVLYKDADYDPVKDFAHISIVTRAPYLLVAHPSLPVKSVQELVAYVKANPGKINFATGGAGSFTHLAAAWMADLAKMQVDYIPYKGTGPSLVDLMAGRVDLTFASPLTTLQHIKSGKMRALATTMATRSKVLPDLPTIAESGVTGYDLNTWHGWSAPARTPNAIVNKMSAELTKVVKSPEIAKKLSSDGGEPVGSTPEEFRKLIAGEMERWRRVVASANIKVQ